MPKALLCHNPNAGNKGFDRVGLEAALKLGGFDVRYASVKDKEFAKELAKPTDIIVAAGGDGTIARVLTKIPDRTVPVAILPLGTANNFARSLGIAGTPQELVETWKLEHTCPVSIGSATGHWGTSRFIEAYGVGVFPQFLLDDLENDKPEGANNLLYGRDLFKKALKAADRVDLTLTIGDKRREVSAFGVEVCNIAFTGPGLPIAAAADASDEKLEAIVFEDRKDLIAWLDAPLDAPPPVTHYRSSKIELAFRDAPTRIDDKPFGATGGKHSVDLECEADQLNVLIPVKHPVQKVPEKRAKKA